MAQLTVPLPPPEEKPGKLEHVSKKLLPFALMFFLLSLGYYFSVLFMNREIKVREIKPAEEQTETTPPSASPAPTALPDGSSKKGQSTREKKDSSSKSTEAGSTGIMTGTVGSMDKISSGFPENNETVNQIPSPVSSITALKASSPSPVPFHNRINLNTAKADDFTNLPGLGVKKSLAIIEYRRSNGPFKSTEDIMKVKGIGRKLYEKIKDRIYID